MGGTAGLVDAGGRLRCLPCHWPNIVDRMGGMDGFFAARLVHSRK
jgi:hypothetical protein